MTLHVRNFAILQARNWMTLASPFDDATAARHFLVRDVLAKLVSSR
jgi:hypothetical protein